MKNLRAFFILSSALVIAGSFYASTASTQAASLKSCMAGGLTKAECACEIALEKGTKQAIRDFLKSYPRSKTACSATAFVPNFIPGDDNDNSSSGDRPNGGNTPSGNGGDDEDDGHDDDDDDDDDDD